MPSIDLVIPSQIEIVVGVSPGAINLSNYAKTSDLVSASGDLNSNIVIANSDVNSINGLTGAVLLTGAGNVYLSTVGQTIGISGSAPDLSSYATTSDLNSTGSNLSSSISQLSSQTGNYYLNSNPSGYQTAANVNSTLSSYLTTASAASTYLTIANAATGYYPLSSNPSNYLTSLTGAVLTTGTQTIGGAKTFSSQITSSVANGTAPFIVTSTTVVANLNAANAVYATTAGTATSASTASTLSAVLATSLGGFGLSQSKTDSSVTGSLVTPTRTTGWLNFTGSVATTWVGIPAGTDGMELLITNSSSTTLSLAAESSNASSSDRMAISVTQVLQPKDAIKLKYNATLARWVLANTIIRTYTSPLSINTSGAVSMTAASIGSSGYVTTSTQTFTGAKTFDSNIYTYNVYGIGGGVTQIDLNAGIVYHSNVNRINLSNSELNVYGYTNLNWDNCTLSSFGTSAIEWSNRVLIDSNYNTTVDWEYSALYSYSIVSLDWATRKLWDSYNYESLDWESRLLKSTSGIVTAEWGGGFYGNDGSGATAIDCEHRLLKNSSGVTMLEWNSSDFNAYDGSAYITARFDDRELYGAGGSPVTLDWNNQVTNIISPVTRIGVGGANVQSDDTFGGYTIGQIVAALKQYKILA